MNIRILFLVLLCLQNSIYTLLRRYTQLSEGYSSSGVLCVGEVMKILFSIFMMQRTADEKTANPEKTLPLKLQWLLMNSWKMFMLCMIYAAMNLLSFVSLARCDATTFTVAAQMKVLTTALCATIFLQRSLTGRHWRALITLVCGVCAIAIETQPKRDPVHGSSAATDTEVTEWLIGVFAVLLEVTLSGAASVYLEKIIKADSRSQVSVWENNFLLAVYSIALYGVISIVSGGTQSTGESKGFFYGWSFLTLIVSALGAAGGLLVALSIKYTDSVLKSVAVAGAIVVTTIGSKIFLNGPLNLEIVIGACVATVSVISYSSEPAPSAPAPVIVVPAAVPDLVAVTVADKV